MVRALCRFDINLVQTVVPDWRQIELLMALDFIIIPAVTALTLTTAIMTRSLFGEGTQAIGGSQTSSYLDSPQLVRLGNLISDAIVGWDPNILGKTTMTRYSLQWFWPPAHVPRYMLLWHISHKENILSCLGYNQLNYLVLISEPL